jgi:hypothetical protein
MSSNNSHLPALLISLFYLPFIPYRRFERWRLSLDASVIVAVLFGYGWYFILAPAMTAHLSRGSIGFPLLLATSYPVFDLLVLAILLIRSAQWQRSAMKVEAYLIALGILFWLAADGYFVARCFIDGLPISHPIEAGWTWGVLVWSFVGVRSLRLLEAPAVVPVARDVRDSLLPADWITQYGTYLALPLGLVLVLFGQYGHPLQWIGVQIGMGIVMLLLIARQVVQALDLEEVNSKLVQLSGDLESRVQSRTRELELG